MKRRAAPPADIFDLLPPELRREAFPQFCSCRPCMPSMTDAEREQHQATVREWNKARRAWCRSTGVTLLQLMRAERPRPAPSKRRTAPSGTRRNGNARDK